VNCSDVYGLKNVSETRYFTVDTNGLFVDLLYPPSTSVFSTDTIEFSYNTTDDQDSLLNCDILVNNETIDSYNATNGNITNRTVIFSTGGLKIWNVTCWDDALNSYTSETRNFTLAFAPNVQLSDPASGSAQNSSTISLIYYIIDDNNNIANTTLILNGLFNLSNQSEIINDDVNNFTLTLSDGVYFWSVNATDNTNLISNSSTWNFTIDTQIPNLNLNYPEPYANLTWNNITFNFSVYDNLDKFPSCDLTILGGGVETFSINAQNGTDNIFHAIKSDGNYSWYIECWDDAGNYNITEIRNFTMNAPPNVTLVSPNGNFYNISNVDFIYLPEDPIGLFNCSLYIDDVFNDTTQLMSNKQNNTFSVSGLNEGQHNWTVECTDVAPDLNPFRPEVKTFTIDLTPPSIIMNNPENNTNQLRDILFNFTVSDNYAATLDCDLYIDNKLNESNFFSNPYTHTTLKTKFSPGNHSWYVSCIDTVSNIRISEIYYFNVTIPDLATNFSSIYLNNSNPKENQTILITATVYNLVNVSVSNVTVQFYLGNPSSSGTQIGQNQTISVTGLNQTNVSVEWPAIIGPNSIFFLIDPPISTNGSIFELNESNNQANISLSIEGWHYVYGDINSGSELELADIDSNRVIIWSDTNFTNGNIYVTDYESLIYWPSITAIGKNITGGNSTNDFSEIDTLLNMTSFPDSVYKIFTNSGIPTNTTTYKIFNKYIYETPIANSTNNTNFNTGILWDSSDSNNSEFDTSEAEDLVFITKIDRDKPGAYGTYDYEIRIPAKLREYKKNQLTGVIFYTEIY
jgi:hypothetical protein